MAKRSPPRDHIPVSCYRTQARLDFRGLADGPAPARFGPGAALSTADPPHDPTTYLSVVGGRLTNAPTVGGRAAGYYTSANLGAPVTAIGARWTFTARRGTPGVMALLVSQTALNWPLPVHLVITPNRWGFGVWPPAGATPNGLQTLRSGCFRVPLDQDGTRVYQARADIDGDRADIELPDGRHQRVRDSRIGEWAGPFATFEAYANHGFTDSQVGFTEIWAESAGPVIPGISPACRA